jgi:hypothetical protein
MSMDGFSNFVLVLASLVGLLLFVNTFFAHLSSSTFTQGPVYVTFYRRKLRNFVPGRPFQTSLMLGRST